MNGEIVIHSHTHTDNKQTLMYGNGVVNNNNFFPSFTFNHICNMAATCEKKTRKERDPFKDFAN